MSTHVLDASALLAYLHGEPGGEQVQLEGACVSSVNWSEVVQKALTYGIDVDGLRHDVEALGVYIAPFTVDEAEQAAALWSMTKHVGLSLMDRACLAVGLMRGLPVVTANKPLAEPELEVEVRLIR